MSFKERLISKNTLGWLVLTALVAYVAAMLILGYLTGMANESGVITNYFDYCEEVMQK